jgi:hypothetical protein
MWDVPSQTQPGNSQKEMGCPMSDSFCSGTEMECQKQERPGWSMIHVPQGMSIDGWCSHAESPVHLRYLKVRAWIDGIAIVDTYVWRLYTNSFLQPSTQDMSLDHVAHALPTPHVTTKNPMHTPVPQAASPSMPCGLLQTMHSLHRLHASLYMANAASASIYKQGREFNGAGINDDIIWHDTFYMLRHARTFRFTYLQPSTCKNACSITICLAPVMWPPGKSHIKSGKPKLAIWEAQIYTPGHPQLPWSFPPYVGTPAKSVPHRTHYVLETVRPYGSGKRVDWSDPSQ